MERVVGFVGYECEDIAIYLAKIMNSMGKRVAIVDRTEQEMLVEVLGLQAGRENGIREGEFAGIWVTDQSVSFDEYDIVFFLFGYRLIHPKLYECDCLIMVTDGVPAHASLLKKIGNWERRQYLLMRNLVPMRHTEVYLSQLAESKDAFCEIPYNEQDIRMRCSLGAYNGCSVSKVSEGMKRALLEVCVFLYPEYQGKNLRKILKKI